MIWILTKSFSKSQFPSKYLKQTSYSKSPFSSKYLKQTSSSMSARTPPVQAQFGQTVGCWEIQIWIQTQIQIWIQTQIQIWIQPQIQIKTGTILTNCRLLRNTDLWYRHKYRYKYRNKYRKNRHNFGKLLVDDTNWPPARMRSKQFCKLKRNRGRAMLSL